MIVALSAVLLVRNTILKKRKAAELGCATDCGCTDSHDLPTKQAVGISQEKYRDSQ